MSVKRARKLDTELTRPGLQRAARKLHKELSSPLVDWATSYTASADAIQNVLSVDLETMPVANYTVQAGSAAAALINEYAQQYAQQTWSPMSPQFGLPPNTYPGLNSERRVVLDLAFNGHRMSGEIVDKRGELLGIADPADKFDVVPGARVARMPLGLAVEKLMAADARFDLIVCELPTEDTTPRVGVFAPPRPPLAKSGRRLLLPGAPAPKAPVGEIDLTLAVWRATQMLLSQYGEALIGMHASAFNRLIRTDEPGVKQVWWAHIDRTNVRVYLRHNYVVGARGNIMRTAPRLVDRQTRLNAAPTQWTRGQRDIFIKTLTP